MNKDISELYQRLKEAKETPVLSYNLSSGELYNIVDYMEKMEQVKEYLESIKRVVGSTYTLQKIYDILESNSIKE